MSTVSQAASAPFPKGRPNEAGAMSPRIQSTGENIVSSSTSALITLAGDRLNSFHASVAKLLNAPKGTPGALEVVTALVLAIEQVIAQLAQPDPRCIGWLVDAKGLQASLQERLQNSHASAPSALDGKKSKHPVWVAFARLGASMSTDRTTLTLAGCALLRAMHLGKPISASLAKELLEVHAEDDPLSAEQLTTLLWAELPSDAHGKSWIFTIRRYWRDIIRLFAPTQTPPTQSVHERIRAQLLSSALNAQASHTAGARNHRLLSERQFGEAIHFIRDELNEDTLAGVLGLIVLRSGLAIDVASMLEVGLTVRVSATGFVDLQRGVVELDISKTVNEAGQPIAGALPSDYRLQIRLPTQVHQRLQARLLQTPSATSLADLFPNETTPQPKSSIYPCQNEIKPTWSRLRHTLGLHLRLMGVNNLLAALLSGDLGIIPRSKLHYAMVDSKELYEHEFRLYSQLAFGEPVPLPADAVGFGSRVVPTPGNMKLHDGALVDLVNQSRPWKRATLAGLRTFHNHYTLLCAWRLSVLLALRETRHIDLDACIDAANDKWIPIHDKHTKEDRGFQPVPLCPYAADIIHLYKAHCLAMASRIMNLRGHSTPFTHWCVAVANGNNQRLLSLVNDVDEIDPVGSNAFTASLLPGFELPPDVGRKVMENELRAKGMRASDVDAVLRHFTRGQESASAFNPSELQAFVNRTARAQQQVAESLFGPRVIGLSKG